MTKATDSKPEASLREILSSKDWMPMETPWKERSVGTNHVRTKIRCFADCRQKLRNIPSHNLVNTFFCPLREPGFTIQIWQDAVTSMVLADELGAKI